MGGCLKCLQSEDSLQEPLRAGSSSESNAKSLQQQPHLGLDLFDIERVLGHGAFGKVFLVTKKDTGQVYAMKSCKKDQVEKRNQITRLKTEREIMGGVDYPFIVQLRFAFQTHDKLYMIMDFINGGELFFHLRRAKRFTEEKARFYGAEILLALNYLHSLDIIYRDLKPENILIDSEGHIKVTDFGLSKKFFPNGEKAFSFCGTPEYLAPEILQETGHDLSVDYWSLGILIYEMLAGCPPFRNKNQEALFKDIISKAPQMKTHFSSQASSLLFSLLEADPKNRLSNFNELKKHPFFEGINWEALERREVIPPFKPKISGPKDIRNFDREYTEEKAMESYDGGNMSSGQKLRNRYEGFTYDPMN